MACSPQLTGFGQNTPSPSDVEGNRPPSYLFGGSSNKRRSIAISGHNPYVYSHLANTGGPATNIFACSTPTHVKESGGLPGSAGKSVHWSPALDDHDHSSVGVGGGPDSLRSHRPRLGSSIAFAACAKGPPLRSIRDEMEPVLKSPRVSESRASAPAASDRNASSSNSSPADDHWVTVFGFPNNYSDQIIKLFSRHGEVVAHQVPNRGNWVHLRYSCDVHAKQALARNSSVIDGCIRIGVLPCTQLEHGQTTTRNAALNESIVEARRVEGSENDSFANSSLLADNSMNVSRMSMGSRAGMRQLAETSLDSSSFLRNDGATKDSSLINRLWSGLVGN